jgi:Spy/CpxP family protein refolding chaperone
MKINKISLAIMAATAALAISPTVFAQSTNPPAGGGGAGGQGRQGGRGGNTLTLEAVDKAVTLTEAEKPKVKTALEEYTKAMAEVRQADQSERQTKRAAATADLNKKMKEILTPEQYTKFQAMPRPGAGRRGQGGGGAGGGAGGAGGAGAN